MVSKDSKKKTKTTSDSRRNIWLLIVTTLVIIASIFLFMPPNEKINQGLDIKGGLSVVLTASSTDGDSITDEDMEDSRAIIENRVNALGASEAVVQVQGNNQILVQIPGLSDTQTALNTIGKTGKLEFARLDSFTDEDAKSKIESGNYGENTSITDEFGNAFPSTEQEKLTVEDGTYTPIVTGENIERVTVDRASEASAFYAVNITLDASGTEAFAEASKELVDDHGQIVIILDNEVNSAPAVQDEITTGNVSITGNYSIDEANGLRTVLESGSLPVSFEYSQSQVVGPTLGQDALFSGVLAAILGIALVMIYLLFFYKGLGTITAGAVIVFAVMYLGILAGLSAFGMFSLTLSGIAGIVLTIGMAADSSVLTVERFREEIRMGRSIKAASITGVRHAIQTSIDADLVSLVSALTLFFLASASVKGFGLTLALGILCDIVMMLMFKAPLIRLLAPRTIAKHPGFWNVKDGQVAAESFTQLGALEGVSAGVAELGEALDWHETDRVVEKRAGADGLKIAEAVHNLKGRFIKHDINFVGHRKVFLIISAVLVVGSLAVIGIKGMTFGIEFVGGTSITFHETGDVSLEDIRAAFNEEGHGETTLQTTDTNGEEGYLARMTIIDAQEAGAIAQNIASKFGWTSENFEVTTIGPDWGSSVISQSLLAFCVALVLLIIYIGIRFEFKMGFTAVVVLLHDLIIVVGIYALVGREFTPNAVAALLSLIGYSLYDTVVVFHRIADNAKDFQVKTSFYSIANHSLNQVFIRSLNTTITSLLPVVMLLMFGGETLKDFAFALVVGLVIGCYSSIAVGTPLFSIWKTREMVYKKAQAKYSRLGQFEFQYAGATLPAPALSTKAPAQKVTNSKQTKAKGKTSDPKQTAAYTPAAAEHANSNSLDDSGKPIYQTNPINPKKQKRKKR